MSLAEILGIGSGSLFVLLCLIQISPLKINPWSKIAKMIGRAINSEQMEMITKMNKRLDQMDERIDKNEIDRLRSIILNFASACKGGRFYTQEDFDDILELYDKYEEIIARRGLKNGKITRTHKYILDLYSEHMANGDF